MMNVSIHHNMRASFLISRKSIKRCCCDWKSYIHRRRMAAFVHLNGMNCGTDISGAIDLIPPNEPHVSILGVDFHDR